MSALAIPPVPRPWRWALAVFAFGLLYTWVMTQGLPLWDDDFTSWFRPIEGRSFGSLLLEWLSPISTQPQHWGFNERPFQKVVYRLLWLAFGYRSWAYFLFKDLAFAGSGALITLWGLRMVPPTRLGAWAASLAGAFFMLAPGPMASLVLYCDYAPVAEFFFLALTYWMWGMVESTPEHWQGLPKLGDAQYRRWAVRWLGAAVLTYLAYKCKADLKLIPGILALYVLCVRRKQWAYFALPIGAMVLLALPWGRAAFEKLPPFLPGSGGSEVNWMWQAPSLDRWREFFWSGQGLDLWSTLQMPTLSLSAVLGPFLLVPLVVFLLWKAEALDKLPWRRLRSGEERARAFALLWTGTVFVSISSLAAINYTFRIRYGIMPLVPISLLLAWAFGQVAASLESQGQGIAKKAPTWVGVTLLAGWGVQSLINIERSARYRHDMGIVMVAVDQAYEALTRRFADRRVALLPDFRPYDYRMDAPAPFSQREWLKDGQELVQKNYPEGSLVLSWSPSLWDRLEIVERFSGCRSETWFDHLYPCSTASGAWLMKFVPTDPEYAKGEELRGKKDMAGALQAHERFLLKHPQSPAGYFVLGLEAMELGKWERAHQAFGWLEDRLPEHLSVLYNHALVLENMGKAQEALPRLEFILSRDPQNYGAMLHLFYDTRSLGRQSRAYELMLTLQRLFPNEPEVRKLSGG